MAKNLKLNIKNTQLAEALNIGKIKPKKSAPKEVFEEVPSDSALAAAVEEEPRRVKARAKKSAQSVEIREMPSSEEVPAAEPAPEPLEEPPVHELPIIDSISAEITVAPLPETAASEEPVSLPPTEPAQTMEVSDVKTQESVEKVMPTAPPSPSPSPQRPHEARRGKSTFVPLKPLRQSRPSTTPVVPPPSAQNAPPKLGPTGKHVKDLLKPKPFEKKESGQRTEPALPGFKKPGATSRELPAAGTESSLPKAGKKEVRKADGEDESSKKGKVKEFHDVKPLKKQAPSFDGRARQGLIAGDDGSWRKKRPSKHHSQQEAEHVIRPTSLSIRLPITLKDLAAEMKLKASELVTKLFMQGMVVTLNDILDDETAVQLLGHEFGCQITIDTSEEERIKVTNQTIAGEIASSNPADLVPRAPVVAFMGHVDHGKTSLIDAIRKSNRAASEAGAITQHIGAFCVSASAGNLTVLDTPGHEAFSAMRERGASVTDIVVLVIAGDEGMRQQTIEALGQAKKAGVTIVVALNKCDKPGFNAEQVYQQLASHELIVEAWGGTTICVKCSAVTGEGIPELLDMLALQSDVLELKANPMMRARGTVLESEMHKGFGTCATILVQNGTLQLGDAVVFSKHFGRIKTMHDEFGHSLQKAGPSTPVRITGLSGLPEAGEEFVVVKNEKEARQIAEVRQEGLRQHHFQQKKRLSLDNLAQKAAAAVKEARFIVKADVQGSLEALCTCLKNIRSEKIEVNIIASSVGEISESDVELAAASSAIIIGFHTQIESHAEPLIKEMGVKVYTFNIIYHAIEEVKKILVDQLDKIARDKELGEAEVIAVFKASQLGLIAGCMVLEGSILRNAKIRVTRGGNVVWKGSISSLKRVKEDVREVKKGFECGILLDGFKDIQVGDHIQAYEIEYLTQEL